MLKVGALLICLVVAAEASLKVTRSSRDGRHPTAMEVEVQLPYTGKKVTLPLQRIDSFESLPVTVRDHGVQRTFSAAQLHNPSHAHYNDIESRSVISVREVNGEKQFSGHFMHEGQSYFVQPVGKDHNIEANPIKPQHLMQQLREKALSRKRRQTQTTNAANQIELQICIDSTVYAAFNTIYGSTALSEMHYYYTHILNGIYVVFQNIEGYTLNIVATSLVISQSASDDAWMPSSGVANRLEGSVILEKIAGYKAGLGTQPDHVMAFTREDITGGGSRSVCGMAYLSAACTNNGVSINEDQGLQSWGTAAHELAHNMGSPHDGSGNACDPNTQNIMSPSGGFYSLENVANSYRFSTCTQEKMKEYIDSLGTGSCLLTRQGTKVSELSQNTAEGARVSLDQVCKLSYPTGPGKFFLFSEASANPAVVCAKIYCETASGGGTAAGGMRAPAGTPCGNKKACNWNGACVSDPNAPAADDNCYWGDNFSASNCAAWVNAVQHAEYKHYCSYVKANCCKSIGKACA